MQKHKTFSKSIDAIALSSAFVTPSIFLVTWIIRHTEYTYIIREIRSQIIWQKEFKYVIERSLQTQYSNFHLSSMQHNNDLYKHMKHVIFSFPLSIFITLLFYPVIV